MTKILSTSWGLEGFMLLLGERDFTDIKKCFPHFSFIVSSHWDKSTSIYFLSDKYIMYNSFSWIFHNNLHLIIDLNLICNAYYLYELKMFHLTLELQHSKAQSCGWCCANQELEPREQHRCGTRKIPSLGMLKDGNWFCRAVLWRMLSACQQSEGHVLCYLFNCAVTASSSMSLTALTRMTNCRSSSDC